MKNYEGKRQTEKDLYSRMSQKTKNVSLWSRTIVTVIKLLIIFYCMEAIIIHFVGSWGFPLIFPLKLLFIVCVIDFIQVGAPQKPQ